MNLDESNSEFFKLLEHPQIMLFIKSDKCMALMDKYILSAILLFFRRANFERADYNCKNFYLTLYLIHELYEEIEDFKYMIIEYYITRNNCNEFDIDKFLQERFALLQRMNYDGRISRSSCVKVMKTAPHSIWNRTRRSKHSGVFYKTFSCKHCLS